MFSISKHDSITKIRVYGFMRQSFLRISDRIMSCYAALFCFNDDTRFPGLFVFIIDNYEICFVLINIRLRSIHIIIRSSF